MCSSTPTIRTGTAWPSCAGPTAPTKPYGIRMWCLGNEMDGPWQTGHRTAARLRPARRRRRRGRCASSTRRWSSSSAAAPARQMPTFGAWERTVLEHDVRRRRLHLRHAYYEQVDGDLGSFLASAVDMDHFIEQRRRHRRQRRRPAQEHQDDQHLLRRVERLVPAPVPGRPGHRVHEWPVAPRLHRGLLHRRRRRGRRQPADLAAAARRPGHRRLPGPAGQRHRADLTEPGGPAWRQTTFYPFAITSRLARGEVLRVGARRARRTRPRGTARSRRSTRSPPTTPDTGDVTVFVVNRAPVAAGDAVRCRDRLRRGCGWPSRGPLADDDLTAGEHRGLPGPGRRPAGGRRRGDRRRAARDAAAGVLDRHPALRVRSKLLALTPSSTILFRYCTGEV